MILFPTSIDSFVNPIPDNFTNAPSLSGQQSDQNDALEAIETKVGINGSADTNSLDYKINNLTKSSVGLSNVDNTSDATKNAAAVTLTNKRITRRILSATNYTTDTGTSLNCNTTDTFIVTAQAGALKFNNPTGTPTDGQTLWLAVTGTGARALTWDTQYEASTIALPTTTVTTARIDIGFVWVSATSKWRCVAQS